MRSVARSAEASSLSGRKDDTYASAEAGAGAVNAAEARVVTKGSVSLALSGTGKGFDLDVSFGKFVITKRK